MKKRYIGFIIIVITLVMVVMVYGREKGSIALSSTFRDSVNNTKTEDVDGETEKDNETVNAESKGSDELNFIVATDIHYLADSLYDDGAAIKKYFSNSDGRQSEYSEELVEAFKYSVIEKQPEVLIISGDLTNNGEKASHEEMANKLSEIENSGTEVLVIPGNHDINNPWARGFVGDKQVITETVTEEDFATIYADFGYSEAISRDEESLSYLAKANEEVWVLMLDTAKYDSNTYSPMTSGRLSSGTLDWIKNCAKLAKESNVQIVTAMHHNLYNHSDLLNSGFTIDNNIEVFNAFVEAGLNFVLTGHIHIQDIKVSQEKEVYDIVTSALIVYPHQYGEITYNKDNGFVYTTEKTDVEGWARDTGVEDENLLNFTSFSRKHFYDRSYAQTYNSLIDTEEFTEEEAKAMANTMAELNVNYFSGTSANISEEIKASEGYKLWETKGNTFFKSYVLSMAEPEEDYNLVEIPKQVRN